MRDLRLFLDFLSCAAANLVVVGAVDSWRLGRMGYVSDGGVVLIDAVGIGLLGFTLLLLRLRSRSNVNLRSVVTCAVIPGIVLLLGELLF